MQNNLSTERLRLGPLTNKNAAFILELVNTPGWLKFIGDRNVKNLTGARAYIKKIKYLINTKYWIVYPREADTPIGIITFIKRDYLDHPDIGFAFLPGFMKLGYAFEATTAVLNSLRSDAGLKTILATTIPENSGSIALLTKFGFKFERRITVGNLNLHLYKLRFDAAGS